MTQRVRYPEATRALLSATLLDAVDDLVREQGWTATTMSQVATAAGVSRQTVYNEFGSRQGLAEAYVLRQVDSLLSQVERTIRTLADDPQAALVGAVALFLRLAADQPLIATIVRGDQDDGLLTLLTRLGRSVAGARLSALIGATWPVIGDVDAALLADSVVRLGISHAVLPTGAPDEAAAAMGRLLGPYVASLFAAGSVTATGRATARRPGS